MNIIQIPGCEHYSDRPPGPITSIVIHDTGAKTARSTTQWFLNKESKVSSHYLVDRDGRIYQFVQDVDAAWHAGMSVLHGKENVNDFSIGIELVDADNTPNDPYPAEQLSALIELVSHLCHEYRIPVNRIVGHCDIATPHGRKIDPGKDFPWYDFLNTIGSHLSMRTLE